MKKKQIKKIRKNDTKKTWVIKNKIFQKKLKIIKKYLKYIYYQIYYEYIEKILNLSILN